MPTPCWLKHLCSIRAWVPMSVYLSVFLSLSLSLSVCVCVCVCISGWFSGAFWLIPCSMKAGCVTQGILASFLLSLSHCRLQTTRFRSIKGPTLLVRLPSEFWKLPVDLPVRGFPGVWKLLLFYDSLPRISVPNSFVSLFIFYILSYLLLKTMGCFPGCLMSSASVQKLFCGVCSVFKCFFWWICGGESGLPILFLCHLSSSLLWSTINVKSCNNYWQSKNTVYRQSLQTHLVLLDFLVYRWTNGWIERERHRSSFW